MNAARSSVHVRAPRWQALRFVPSHVPSRRSGSSKLLGEGWRL